MFTCILSAFVMFSGIFSSSFTGLFAVGWVGFDSITALYTYMTSCRHVYLGLSMMWLHVCIDLLRPLMPCVRTLRLTSTRWGWRCCLRLSTTSPCRCSVPLVPTSHRPSTGASACARYYVSVHRTALVKCVFLIEQTWRELMYRFLIHFVE